MKNKKPLQFVKELPPHAELWKIIDETIIHPAEGLSVEQIKHHMYVYLCSSKDFKYDKLMLQTNIEIEHLQHVKSKITKHRDLSYPELLPTVEGLPSSLLIFIYNHYIHTEVLGIEAYNIFKNIITTLTYPLPYLSTLPHSDEVVEVSSKRDLEIVIYKALIENMPIPTFKLVAKSAAENSETDNLYPLYRRAKNTGLVVKFTGKKTGEVVDNGTTDHHIGAIRTDWVSHTDTYHWDNTTPEPVESSNEDEWIPWNGGECPVDGDTILEIKLRNGYTNEIKEARQWKWNHLGGIGDIVAYRIVKEAE